MSKITETKKQEIIRLYNTGRYTQGEIGEKVGMSDGIVGYWLRILLGNERQKLGVAKSHPGKRITEADKKEILRLYSTGKYTQEEVGQMIGHSESGAGYWIRRLRGSQPDMKISHEKSSGTPATKGSGSVIITESKGTVSNVHGKSGGKTKTKKPVKHEINIPEEMNFEPGEIKMLKESDSSDTFIKGYLQTFGFDHKQVSEIQGMWAKKDEIIEFDRKKHEVKPVVKTITEHADEEVGSTPSLETLVIRTNQFLAENIQLHKEMLDIAKKQFVLFEDIQARAVAGKTTTYIPSEKHTVFPHEHQKVTPMR